MGYIACRQKKVSELYKIDILLGAYIGHDLGCTWLGLQIRININRETSRA
jgi:hypothetical protein